eukprot:8433556-Lingulodinium_polyedra.AAC.1
MQRQTRLTPVRIMAGHGTGMTKQRQVTPRKLQKQWVDSTHTPGDFWQTPNMLRRAPDRLQT